MKVVLKHELTPKSWKTFYFCFIVWILQDVDCSESSLVLKEPSIISGTKTPLTFYTRRLSLRWKI